MWIWTCAGTLDDGIELNQTMGTLNLTTSGPVVKVHPLKGGLGGHGAEQTLYLSHQMGQ